MLIRTKKSFEVQRKRECLNVRFPIHWHILVNLMIEV